MHFYLFFFNDTATTEIYTLSLHDALPICGAAHALLLLVGLLALQGPARVQQPAVQLLLAPDGLLIEASGLELARQLAGFLGERRSRGARPLRLRSEEHTSELQSPCNLVCRLLLEKK